ncbi:MAG: hypothetical protein EOO13_07195 [Chitinophagaceae bacterium]|nr:MAG: hypothetical protein EOO13_07195 [Chitinophagaceae bacterium]
MLKFLRNNSLTLVFLFLFIFSLAGQLYFGMSEYNKERMEDGAGALGLAEYMGSGHFIQATFENWESEFLQMALFVWLTIFLYQKGSSESKKFDGTDEVDKEPDPQKKDAPAVVRRGGLMLGLYKHSLTLTLLLLFVLSFALHLYGSLRDENEQAILKHLPQETLSQFLVEPRFWFESFQNWESEFLSVFAIVILSVFLRQKGSPQSKPVDAPHYETGE